MPLRTNKGSKAEDATNEQLIHVGPLPRTLPNCRDEVIAAFKELIAAHGDRPFTAREVYEQMRERGTSYAGADGLHGDEADEGTGPTATRRVTGTRW